MQESLLKKIPFYSKLQAGIELFKNCTIEIPIDDDENSVYEDED